MTRRMLGKLTGYNYGIAEKESRTYVRLKDIQGHETSITVYHATPEELLPFLTQALKTAGYQGTWREEAPSLKAQLLETVRSFDPMPMTKPCCCKCHEAFKVGDVVVSVRREHGNHRYHQSCYQSTFSA